MTKINFDAPPDAIEPDWKIKPEYQIKSRVRGEWYFGFDRVGLHITRPQKLSETATGWQVLQELKGKPVMGVKLLEHLVAAWKDFRIIFPKKWDGITLFFWGTIYDQDWREQEDQLYVEFLYFDFGAKECRRGYRFLNSPTFDRNCPAAVFVNPKIPSMEPEEAKKKIESIIDDDELDFL